MFRAAPATFLAAAVFHPSSHLAAAPLSYTLYMNHTLLPSTQKLFSDVSVGKFEVTLGPNRDWKKYYLFSNLQLAIDRSLAALALAPGGSAEGCRSAAAVQPLDLRLRVRPAAVNQHIKIANTKTNPL